MMLVLCMIMPQTGLATVGEEPIADVIERGLNAATRHALRMAKSLEKQEGRLPKSIKDGKLETSNYSWWCSGFFPGELWYLYENYPSVQLLKYAQMYTDRVEKAKNITTNHDVGFMLYCSYGNGYRLKNIEEYKDVMVTGANSLITRYKPEVGLIRSWDSNKKVWKYPVIIDNMMNLELLMWASKATGDNKYREIAMSHADKTMKHHFREDYSCYHVVSYDPETGLPHAKHTHQGLAHESEWARGQAWALYGYTMMYRESGKKAYLKWAKNIATYLMNHPDMPDDKVPYWDFDAPAEKTTPRDASAAAIMASALVELGELSGGKFGEKCLNYAEDQIRTLTSDRYLANIGRNRNYVLMHSTGNKNKNSEVDVPLSYADYYYVEALIRLKKHYNLYDKQLPTGADDRKVWVESLTKIADPVLTNLSQNTLKKNMPFQSLGTRKVHSYLEAVGRLYCGLSAWLELGPDDTEEGKLRAKYIDLAVKGLTNAVDPSAADYLDFDLPHQALVDAAFLAEGLLRAPKQLWGNLDKKTQERLITELKRSRAIKPYNNNWLLFASTVEAAILEFAGEYDKERMLHGVNMFRNEWYKGDSNYGDGPTFRQDYYNSFVIHTMLTDVLLVMDKYNIEGADFLPQQKKRLTRYAAIQERMISPEGTYPCVGRSITYRFGAFHALNQAALLGCLPAEVAPAQVRCGLTAVIKRQMKSPVNFDKNGWLTVGFAGNQLNMSEVYINTGSEYLCTFGLIALGLPATDPFWSDPYTEWTNVRAWKGMEVTLDHAVQ